MEKTMNNPKIPQTDSIQELAHFWDTHDLTDFEGQMVEIKETVFERETVVNISLQHKEAEIVKRIAKSKDISYTNLIRTWILEKIHVT